MISLRDALRGARALGELATSSALRRSVRQALDAMIRMEKAEVELAAVTRPEDLDEALAGLEAAWCREVERSAARPWPPIPREELADFLRRRLAEGVSTAEACGRWLFGRTASRLRWTSTTPTGTA